MTAKVCPKCLGFMEVDYEYGPSCGGCDFTGEPVEVPFDPSRSMEEFVAKRDSLIALERFKLAQIEREDDFREAERRWYANLSVADRFWEDSRRKRVREEQIAAARPFDRTMMRMMDAWSMPGIERQLFRNDPLLDWIEHPWPKPDALDVWLSEDGPMPEVEAAFA